MMKNFMRKYSSLVIFLFVFVVGSLISPVFFKASNLFDIIQSCSEAGLVSAGMFLVILSGGSGIDLSVGSNVALGCMIAALTQVKGFPILGSFVVAMFFCGLIGLANGLFITKGRIQPFVATLVTMIGARAFALISNGGMPVTYGIPKNYLLVARGKIGPIFYPAIIWVFVILLVHFIIIKTEYGRDLVATGGNEDSARYSGININKVRVIAYTISGILAGIAGSLLTAKIGIGEPRSGIGLELTAIAAVVMGGNSMAGGKGSALATLFGVLTLAAISNFLNVMDVNMHLQDVVKGFIILVVVAAPFFIQKLTKLSK
jgi:ribose/xylose/arabinose/galactoside ABC-type transport system permease subunit